MAYKSVLINEVNGIYFYAFTKGGMKYIYKSDKELSSYMRNKIWENYPDKPFEEEEDNNGTTE